MPRMSRELRALRKARDRAAATLQAHVVSVGYVRKEGNLGRLHVRSAYERAPKGAEPVAWCSPTGLVRIVGPWCGVVQPTALEAEGS